MRREHGRGLRVQPGTLELQWDMAAPIVTPGHSRGEPAPPPLAPNAGVWPLRHSHAQRREYPFDRCRHKKKGERRKRKGEGAREEAREVLMV